MREKFDKLVHSDIAVGLDKFYNSPWYIACIALVCILGFWTEQTIIAIAMIALLVIPAPIVSKNSLVLMPFLLMFVMCMSPSTVTPKYFLDPLNLTFICIAGTLAIAVLIFHILYYGKLRLLFRRSYLTASLAMVTGLLMVGGVGSSTFSWIGVGISLSIGAAMFIPYSLFVNCGEYNNGKAVEYFAYTSIAAATVVMASFLLRYAQNDFNTDMQAVKAFLKLGYAGPNRGAAIIILSIPMTFYLVYKYTHGYLFMPLVALELFGVIASYSRASLVVAIPGTVIVAIILCFKNKTGRRGYWITFGIFVAVALILLVVFREQIFAIIEKMFKGNVTGSGRTKLWKLGGEAWLKTPVFGLGLWFLKLNGYWYFSFHCTPLTYLYCAGLFGLAAYIYHRYKTVRLVFSAKLTSERAFLALTVLAMLCNALLDIGMTSALHLMFYGVMLSLIENDVRAVKASSPVKAFSTGGEALYKAVAVKHNIDGGATKTPVEEQ